jgi:hypothetical protein
MMLFLKRRKKLFKEIDNLKKAEIDASKNVQKASERLDTIIAQNGFHLILLKAVNGEKHAS